jgi:uncharacterized protein (UPF0303 family)
MPAEEETPMDQEPAALLAELERQEAELQFDRFSNEDALALGLSIASMAKERGAAVSIDISRGEQQLFHYAMAGTSADNDGWIARKRATAARFGRSSLLIGTRLARDGQTIEGRFFVDPRRYSSSGGSFPLILRGTGCVGTITVSGLPQAEDHALVVAAIEKYLGKAQL